MKEEPSDVTTQVMEQPAKLEYPRIELIVVEGPDTGVRRALDLAGVRIGTAQSNELPLRDRTVSRFHCEVRFARSVAYLVDSGSTNGTFVDGVRVRDADLSAGSKVRLGATVPSVSASGERALVDLSPRHSFGGVLRGQRRDAPAVLDPGEDLLQPSHVLRADSGRNRLRQGARGTRHPRRTPATRHSSPSWWSTAAQSPRI